MDILYKYYRQPKATVKLPSLGLWYTNVIENNNNTVPVLSHTTSDELLLKAPDMLMTGESIYYVISSCAPSIKDPRKLLKIDVDALLVGIKIATSGKDAKYKCKCPECENIRNQQLDILALEQFQKKYSELDQKQISLIANKASEIIRNLEDRKQICLQEQEFNINTQDLLDRTNFIDESETTLELSNGLTLKLKPYTFDAYNEFQKIQFQYQKFQQLTKQREDMQLSDAEFDEINKQLVSVLRKLINSRNVLLIDSIEKIITPKNEEVVSKQDISTFINEVESQIIEEIEPAVQKINSKGVPTFTNVLCPYCHKTFAMYGLDFSDVNFFETGL